MPTIKTRLPKTALKHGLSAPRVAKNLLSRALRDDVQIERKESCTDGEWVTLYLSDTQIQQIENAAERDGFTPKAWMESVLVRMAREENRKLNRVDENTKETIKPWMKSRPEQATIHAHVMDAARRGEILLAQAGTGVGKTRVMFAAAMELLASRKAGRVVVAFPSIQTLAHGVAELDLVCRDENRHPPVSIILGSGQFASERRLLEFLQSDALPEEEQKRLEQWTASGGKPVTPVGKAVSQHHPVCFLLDDVAHLAPSMGRADLDAIALTAEEATEADAQVDRGARAYLHPKQQAHQSEILICTHTMLGCHLLSSGKENAQTVLPDFDALMVDEAHLLEANVAQALTKTTSLHMLKRRLQTMAAPTSRAQAVKDVEELESFCRGWVESEGVPTFISMSGDGDFHFDAVKGMASNIHKHIRNAVRRSRKAQGHDLRLMQRDMATMGSLAQPRTPIYLSSTPAEKKWRISLGVGPASVRSRLQDMFAAVKTAVLFSASLAVPDQQGRWNYSYMQTVLGVPSSRAVMMPPVEHAWGYETPEVYCTMASDLCRPREDMPENQVNGELTAYFHRIADFVAEKVLPHAAGGTLILTTGFRMAAEMAKRLLNAKPELQSRLMVHRRDGQPVQAMKDTFIKAARAGKRPVWIATGAAWTGLDQRDDQVSDDAPEKDMVLTDLVIPAVQTQISRGTTYAARSRRRLSINHLAAETFFATMQGMGRLVRRKGLRDRKMWILDPRIWDDDPKRKRWLLPVRRYIEKFPNRKWL